MAKISALDWGAYECVTPLASGGGGDVWLARRLGERDCGLVLKHTRAGESAELAALRREWDALFEVPCAALPLPVAWLEPVRSGPAAMVIDLRPGQTLGKALAGADGDLLSAVVESCLHALMALHAADLVHGDLHPDNILVGRDGAISLLDLGLAQAPGSAPAWGAGHPEYAAPERLRGVGVDPRDDLFSLAVAVWRATGLAHPYADYPAVLPVSGQRPEVSAAAARARWFEVLAGWMHPERDLRPAHAEAALREWCATTERQRHDANAELMALAGRPWRWGRWPVAATPAMDAGGRSLWLTGARGAGRSGALARLAADHRGPIAWLSLSHRADLDPLLWTEAEVGRLAGKAVSAAGATATMAPASSSDAAAIGEIGGAAQALLDRRVEAIRVALGPKGLLLVDDWDDLSPALRQTLARAADGATQGRRAALALAAERADVAAAADRFELPPVTAAEIAQAATTADGGRSYDLAICAALATAVGSCRAATFGVLARLHGQGVVVRHGDRVEAASADVDLAQAAEATAAARSAWTLPPPDALPALAHLAVAGACAPGRDGDPMPPLLARWCAATNTLRVLPGGAFAPVDPAARRFLLEHIDVATLAEAASERAAWLAPRSPVGALELEVKAAHWRGQVPPPAAAVAEAAESLIRDGDPGRAVALADAFLALPAEDPKADLVSLAALRAETALGRFHAVDARVARADPEWLANVHVAVALAGAAFRRGDYPASHAAADRALAGVDPKADAGTAAAALLWRAFAATWQGELAAAAEDVDRGLRLSGDDAQLRDQFTYLAGLAAYYGGDLEGAAKAFVALDASDVVAIRAAAAAGRGLVDHRAGKLEDARAAYAESRQLAELAGDRTRVLNMSMNIATLDHEAGDLGRALDGYDRVISGANRLANDGALVRSLNNRGNLLTLLGIHERAEADLQSALAHLEDVGNQYLEGNVCCVLAELARKAGRTVQARELIARAERVLSDTGAENELLEIRLERAQIDAAAGDIAAARRVAVGVLDAATELASDELQARARRLLAGCHMADAFADGNSTPAQGDLGDALRELEAAAALVPERKALLLVDVEVDRATVLAWCNRWQDAARLAETQLTRLDRIAATLRTADAQAFRHGAAHGPRRTLLRLLVSLGNRDGAVTGPDTGGISGDSAMNAVLALNRRLSAEHDSSRLLEVLMDAAVALTGAERGFLLLDDAAVAGKKQAEGTEPELEVAFARNLDRENLRKPEGKLSQSVAMEVFRGGERVLAVNAMADPRFHEQKSIHAGSLRSILCVPLALRGRTVGVLYVDNRFTSGAFTSEHAAVLEALAAQAAIAIQTARLIERQARSEKALARSKAEVEQLNAKLREQLVNTEDALSSARAALDAQRHELSRRSDYRSIKGESPPLHRLFGLMDRVRKHDFPVVIVGESGTGKELVARAIHFTGSRAGGPFVAVNCGALPENLLESELFGHIKGAFTGAVAERRGLFESANRGTLLLDEVGEMPLSMQVKLLRVLQTGEITPVGGSGLRKVDVRVLTATHRDLSAMAEAGTFREDLLYRLKVVELRVPPLRERPGDIALLAEHFLAVNRKAGLGEVQRIAPRAMQVMSRHPWPGNVRELETFLKSACLFAMGEELDMVDMAPLMERARSLSGALGAADGGRVGGDLARALAEGTLADIELAVIDDRLAQLDGNKSRVAASLGVDRGTLYNKLRSKR